MTAETIDAELGVVRVCARCSEEWPVDVDFWTDESDVCRACQWEAAETRRRQRAAAMRRYRARRGETT